MYANRNMSLAMWVGLMNEYRRIGDDQMADLIVQFLEEQLLVIPVVPTQIEPEAISG